MKSYVNVHPPIIIFDVDGVLLNLHGHSLAIRKLLLDDSLHWNEALRNNITPIEIFRRFDAIDAPSTKKAIWGMYRIFADLLPERRKRILFLIRLGKRLRKFEFLYSDFYPGVIEAIKTLSGQGILIGICSNAESKRLSTWLDQKGLSDIIRCRITRDDRKKFKIKPWPEPILGAIVKIKRTYNLGKIDRSNVAFVGDITTDIKAAKAAKIKAIGVLSGHGYKEELEKLNPDLIIDSVADLPKNLNKLFN